MPLRFVLDEHLRQRLWRAVQRHNAMSSFPIDTVRVGDPPDLPLGSDDRAILLWAERDGRIVITRDAKTMPVHLIDHLASGHHSPGVMIIRPRTLVAEVIDYLVLAAYASEPWEWQDQHRFIPQ